MDLDLVFKFLRLLLLLVLSAFFSGSETGLFSLSSVRIHRLQEEKKKGSFLVAELLREPRKVLATILLANLFVTVFSTSLAEEITAHVLGPKGLTVCILVMSFLILVFCEIVPKVIAVSRSEKVSLQVAPAIRLFMILLAPFRILFLRVANRLIHFIIPPGVSKKELMSPDHLKTAIRMGRQEKILTEEESVMLGGILELKDKTAKERMTPRDKIFAFEIDTPLSTIYDEIRKRKFSRIPIYRKSLDDVVGVLYAKDLVVREIVELRAIQIYDLLRSPYFISQSMKLGQLLREFKSQRLHLALVLDEGKKLSGLITLDDLMEAILGRVFKGRTK